MERKTLLKALKILANKNKEVWASNREIAKATGLVSYETIRVMINELEALGFIKVRKPSTRKRVITLI